MVCKYQQVWSFEKERNLLPLSLRRTVTFWEGFWITNADLLSSYLGSKTNGFENDYSRKAVLILWDLVWYHSRYFNEWHGKQHRSIKIMRCSFRNLPLSVIMWRKASCFIPFLIDEKEPTQAGRLLVSVAFFMFSLSFQETEQKHKNWVVGGVGVSGSRNRTHIFWIRSRNFILQRSRWNFTGA